MTLHHQPIVELGSGRVAGVEALARWTDDELGSVPADRFTAVAESRELIVELGRQVLERACREAPHLRRTDAHADLLVMVNLSPLELAADALVRDVARGSCGRGPRPGLPADRGRPRSLNPGRRSS